MSGWGWGDRSAEMHDEIVCRESKLKNNPCTMHECKHHACHVPWSQSGVEYYEQNLKALCPHYITRANRIIKQYIDPRRAKHD